MTNIGLVRVSRTNFISLSLSIKRTNTRHTDIRITSTLKVHNALSTGTHNNLGSCITALIHKYAIWSSQAVIHSISNLIGATLEPNAAEPERIRYLNRKHNSINRGWLAGRGRKLNTAIQSWVPIQLSTKRAFRLGPNNTSGITIYNHLSRHILNTLLHGRRIYLHIIILRDRQITGIIHLRGGIRHNLTIVGFSPRVSSIITTITVPIQNNRSGLTSSGPNSIRGQHKTGTLKAHLVKNIGQLLILGRSTKERP